MTGQSGTKKKAARPVFTVWSPRFLQSLKNGGNVQAACLLVGINRKTAYRWRGKDPKFAERWDEALKQSGPNLEAAARRRALADSDTLLLYLLREEKRSRGSVEAGPNRVAMDQLLEQVVKEVDPATQQMARSLADALDLDPSNAQMWRTYKDLVEHIREDDHTGDNTDDEIEALRGTTEVGSFAAF